QPSVTAPDVRHKREAWKQAISPEMIDRLVFLDESGINTDMTPIYGWGKRANRVTDSAPLNTPKTTTVLSSIRLNGEKAFTVYTGGTKGQKKIDKPGVCAIIKSFNIGDDEKSPVSAALQRGSGW
ncbi:MAG: transposase, partial [Oscillospiraceae bacterium]|nr:transposase [Oscillospiraceae bacterium]